MNFNNATLLTHNRTSEFFSDTMRYRVNKELTIQGLLLDLTNDNGVQGILSDLENFRLGFLDNWQDVILNGVNFGSGIVSSIVFAEGNDVRTKEYTVSINIPEDGNTNSSGPYQGLNFSNFKYIESFSESSSFTKDVGRDNYTQNINLTIKPPTTIDAIDAAKLIAQNFFDNNSLSNTVGSFTSYAGTKKYYTENYDPVNGEFSFSKTFELYKNSNGTFSRSRNHTINFDEEGVLSVTESAQYIGHTDSPFETVNTQARNDIGGAFVRCLALVPTYRLGGDSTLKSQAISKSWNSNPFEGTISYEVTFSNALRINTGAFSAFHDYQVEIVESQGGTYPAKQNGSIIGFGEVKTSKQRYNNALIYFNSLIFNFNEYGLPGTLKLFSSSTTFSEIDGKIDYDNSYSNNDSIISNATIRQIITKISREYRRNLFSSFNITNFKEIVQIQKNTLPNIISYNVVVNGKGGVGINTFLDAAKSRTLNPPAPSYLNDISYSFDPNQRELNLTVSYLNFETS